MSDPKIDSSEQPPIFVWTKSKLAAELFFLCAITVPLGLFTAVMAGPVTDLVFSPKNSPFTFTQMVLFVLIVFGSAAVFYFFAFIFLGGSMEELKEVRKYLRVRQPKYPIKQNSAYLKVACGLFFFGAILALGLAFLRAEKTVTSGIMYFFTGLSFLFFLVYPLSEVKVSVPPENDPLGIR